MKKTNSDWIDHLEQCDEQTEPPNIHDIDYEDFLKRCQHWLLEKELPDENGEFKDNENK
jgi:hypothetical protein